MKRELSAQTTISQPIRAALRLNAGDEIAYTIDGNHVLLTKAKPAQDDPFAAFEEWASDNDRRAFGIR